MGFRVGFNTQPPEGGWLHQQSQDSDRSSFNTQPPEGGWFHVDNGMSHDVVSTHSRPKAAGSSP